MKKKAGYIRGFELDPTAPLKRSHVEKLLLAIWDEHSARLRSSFAATQEYGLSKNEDAKNFLRREVYALGLALQRSPPTWNVAELITSSRAHQTTRADVLKNNVFQALFMGIYNEDDQISRQERWVMARELEYAARHNVPPEFLCGFVYQSGGRKNLLKKLGADYRERAFRDQAPDNDPPA